MGFRKHSDYYRLAIKHEKRRCPITTRNSGPLPVPRAGGRGSGGLGEPVPRSPPSDSPPSPKPPAGSGNAVARWAPPGPRRGRRQGQVRARRRGSPRRPCCGGQGGGGCGSPRRGFWVGSRSGGDARKPGGGSAVPGGVTGATPLPPTGTCCPTVRGRRRPPLTPRGLGAAAGYGPESPLCPGGGCRWRRSEAGGGARRLGETGPTARGGGGGERRVMAGGVESPRRPHLRT